MILGIHDSICNTHKYESRVSAMNYQIFLLFVHYFMVALSIS